jgi:hypothetical protein
MNIEQQILCQNTSNIHLALSLSLSLPFRLSLSLSITMTHPLTTKAPHVVFSWLALSSLSLASVQSLFHLEPGCEGLKNLDNGQHDDQHARPYSTVVDWV